MPTHRAAGQAAPVAPARTYAQLLEPIPNAVERLKASDNELAVQHYLTPAQHRHRYRRWWHGRWIYYYGPWVAPPVYYGYRRYPNYHHHHHHHHHHHIALDDVTG